MDPTPTFAEPELRGVVASDLPCAGCGYALRSAHASGACPECGVPVRSSLAPDRLLFASPAWLARVRRGLLISAFAPFMGVILLGAGVAAIFRFVGDRLEEDRLSEAFAIAIFGALLAILLVAAGMAGSSDACTSRRARAGRRIASLAVCVPLALCGVAGAEMLLGPLPKPLAWAMDHSGVAVVVAPLAWSLGLGLIARDLARRGRPSGPDSLAVAGVILPVLALAALGVAWRLDHDPPSWVSRSDVEDIVWPAASGLAGCAILLTPALAARCGVLLGRQAKSRIEGPASALRPEPAR